MEGNTGEDEDHLPSISEEEGGPAADEGAEEDDPQNNTEDQLRLNSSSESYRKDTADNQIAGQGNTDKKSSCVCDTNAGEESNTEIVITPNEQTEDKMEEEKEAGPNAPNTVVETSGVERAEAGPAAPNTVVEASGEERAEAGPAAPNTDVEASGVERAEAGPTGPDTAVAAIGVERAEAGGSDNLERLETSYTSLRDNGVEPTLQFR